MNRVLRRRTVLLGQGIFNDPGGVEVKMGLRRNFRWYGNRAIPITQNPGEAREAINVGENERRDAGYGQRAEKPHRGYLLGGA